MALKNGKRTIVLTEDNKAYILRIWAERGEKNPPSIKELVEHIFGKGTDIRAYEGRAVKDFLVDNAIKYTTSDYNKKPNFELDENKKAFIANNYTMMNCLEIAKELFHPNVTPVGMEVRSISNYIKSELNEKFAFEGKTELVDSTDYRPPKTMASAATRVNKYILNCISQEEFKKDSKIQQFLKSLIRFCHQHRFVNIITQLKSASEKENFEGCYVRYVWDKPDLTEEELDLYINLCKDLIDEGRLQKEESSLQSLLETSANDNEGKKLSMSIADALDNLRNKINENKKRQLTLIESLQGKRNDRIDNKSKQSNSLLQLLDFWKNYENRQLMLKLAEERAKKVKDEIKRIENLDDLKMQVWGLDPGEII